MTRRRKCIATVLLSAALLGVILLNGCTGWLARSIIWGPNTDKAIDPAADPPAEATTLRGVDEQLRLAVGPPDASLSVWVVNPPPASTRRVEASPRATMLVLHGINDKKDSMLGVAKDFAAAGYRAVLVDLRAHGRSSGQWLSFGAVESRVLSQVIDDLERRGLLAWSVGVFGPSFGGGIAVQFAGRDPRVKAVVSVCGFTSMRDVTPRVVRLYAPPPAKWLLFDSSIQRAVTEAGRIGNFNPDDASALAAIQRTKAEVLLIHSKLDRKIPPSHSQRLHAAAPDHSRLLLLEGEDHDSLLTGDRAGVVLRESVAWFDKWLRRQSGD